MDLYQGTVLGSTRIVSMGGATVAIGEGSAGALGNSAATAVRPATSNDVWDWDFHLDWLVPAPGTDHDNNGDATSAVDDTLVLTGGLLGWYQDWGLGVAVTAQRYVVETDATGAQADLTAIYAKLMLARTLWDRRLTVGAGFRYGLFDIGTGRAGGRTETLFAVAGSALDAGIVWHPPSQPWRAGFAVGFPVAGKQLQVTACDPMDCRGYVLPERVAVPWQISAGVGWRRGETPWNQHVQDRWRDERSLIAALDVVVTGPVADGVGVESFVDRVRQRSGQEVSISLRAGAEVEWIPGWLRVRAGSYWEPARYEGVTGRLHGTFGVEVRFLSFSLFGASHRARAALTIDGARSYANGGISIGLWH